MNYFKALNKVFNSQMNLIILWMVLHLVFYGNCSTGYFYIDANNGNDSWSGTLPEPNNKDNGPFLTFENAIMEIRKQKVKQDHQNSVLYVRTGTYHILNPIYLDKRDNGLLITRYLRTKPPPVLSGAISIKGSQFQDWIIIAPNTREYRTRFLHKCSNHIFLNDQRLIRARKPNLYDWNGYNFVGEGPYLLIKDLLKKSSQCDRLSSGGFKQRHCDEINKWGFVFGPFDIMPRWKSLKNGGEIMIFQSWTAERMKVKTVTKFNKRVIFQSPLRRAIGEYPRGSGWRYIIENTYEVLDSIGEFYCHERRRFLSIVAPLGFLSDKTVFIANNANFFKVKGAKNIKFAGLNFQLSGDNNFYGYNANPAVLQFFQSDSIEVIDCNFRHIGHTAISVKSCTNIQIRENIFFDIGYKGVILEYEDDPYDLFATRNATIRKNSFNGCGIMNMLQPSCIHVRGVSQINVVSNRISRVAYAGIQVGWQRAFDKDYIKNDVVFRLRQNHIYKYGQRILNDFAGIYVSTNQRDCGVTLNISMCHIHALIEENVIDGGQAYSYGGKGVYTDTAASSVTVRKNWISRSGDASIAFHCGNDNLAISNMILHTNKERVFGLCNKSVGKNGLSPTQTASFRNNVIYVLDEDARMWRKNDFWYNKVPHLDKNIYFFKSSSQHQLNSFFPKNLNISTWRSKTNNDRKSLIVDPQFVDVASCDLRLQPTSPATLLGIRSVDLRRVSKSKIP